MAKEYLTVNGKLVTVDGKLVQVPDPEKTNDLVDEQALYATQFSKVINEIENLLVNGVIDGSPKGVYNNLTALQTAYPNGASGVYLTSNNGHWYYYNEGWKDGGVYCAGISDSDDEIGDLVIGSLNLQYTSGDDFTTITPSGQGHEQITIDDDFNGTTFLFPTTGGTIALTKDIPTKTSELENDSNYLTSDNGKAKQAEWADEASWADESGYAENAGQLNGVGASSYALKTELFSKDYNELNNKPTIPTTLPASDVYEWAKASTKPTYTASEVGAYSKTESDNKYAVLDTNGKVPSTQLPSYVDDVLEYASLSSFPASGESGKIYIAVDTGKTYRWSGSQYVVISESLALGETDSTAYSGAKGKANAEAIANLNGQIGNINSILDILNGEVV